MRANTQYLIIGISLLALILLMGCGPARGRVGASTEDAAPTTQHIVLRDVTRSAEMPTATPIGSQDHRPVVTQVWPPTVPPGSKVKCKPLPPPSHTTIDWVHFIQFNGIQYLAMTPSYSRPLRTTDIGPVFARVRFTVSTNVTDPRYHTKDGDAAYLTKGTPVYKMKGYDPSFRLIACRGKYLYLFEADSNPRAKQGSDLLDIRGKVRYISINSDQDGTTELAAIRNPKQVSRLVNLVLDSSINREARPPSNGWRYFIEFHFRDGTSTTRAYWPGSDYMSRGIMTPDQFADAIGKALH